MNVMFEVWFKDLRNLIFCWLYITVYQYSETNVKHFLFSLVRIKGLYLFRASLANPQEMLHAIYQVPLV
jgi:hypothetical protein